MALADKWGIPYWYPTKKTAGITNSGQGFFWEQANNFRDDEDDGFLRLGKETDDCELIDLATGTWEFPYLTDGDGISISGPTGHHSGGESHGCEGFTYMCDCNFEANPPRFRFRKETYHVQYNDHPDGEFTSPLATQVTSNKWKGLGWVRYNKKDGRGPGKDSVICEVWWNDDPEADIKNWVMLKRVEDKGAGITNWGVGATCDGAAYQVGTWSNIQFRWKSSSSDFSLHPLEPEFNDGENIHSIDGADMSFSESEERGYGYQARMPRDIEMKGLFKWDAGGAGKCHFKNLSLREIDPTIGFDEDPTTPPPTEEPGQTTTLRGIFTFKQDINHIRGGGACQGTGGGGGSGGGSKFYDVVETFDRELSNNAVFGNRIAAGEYITNSNASMVGKIIKQFDARLKKVGTPGASPTITCKIKSSSGATIYTSTTTIDPTTLTTDYATYSFNMSTNNHVMVLGDRLEIGYTGTSSTNYIMVGVASGDPVPYSANYSIRASGFQANPTTELAGAMWS
jgi:hypothetical protein